MLNVRLDDGMEDKIKKYSEEHNLSKSSVVKEALAQYFNKKEMSQNPYELGSDLFGTANSGSTDLSKTYKSKLKEKLHAKHSG
ncbi:MAG: hypothetical protein AB8B61_06885 [Cyclobacteriaceae bacterium]